MYRIADDETERRKNVVKKETELFPRTTHERRRIGPTEEHGENEEQLVQEMIK